jgi:hypothetical protein
VLAALPAVLALASGVGQEDAARAPLPVATGFRYESGRIPVGRVHRYQKSNLDGSSPSEIALYLASETRLEALKWHAGEPGATLVVAEMDWEVASARGFRTYQVDEHGNRALAAELETSADRRRLVARVGGKELACALERFPWHSYDFDLASLNVALRFLADPTGEVELAIVDPVYRGGTAELVAKGPVVLAYRLEEERSGLPCRRYLIDGPGLEDRGGSLWVAQGDEVFLVAFEIDLPDEPGMSSGRLEWLRNETRSAAEWERLVLERDARESR